MKLSQCIIAIKELNVSREDHDINVRKYDIIIIKFELQSRYYVQIGTITCRNAINLLISLDLG